MLGYRIGIRVLELMTWRTEAQSKAPKREIRFLPALMSIHTQVWRTVFGKPADAIEKSVEHDDECRYLCHAVATPPQRRALNLMFDYSARYDHRQRSANNSIYFCSSRNESTKLLISICWDSRSSSRWARICEPILATYLYSH